MDSPPKYVERSGKTAMTKAQITKVTPPAGLQRAISPLYMATTTTNREHIVKKFLVVRETEEQDEPDVTLKTAYGNIDVTLFFEGSHDGTTRIKAEAGMGGNVSLTIPHRLEGQFFDIYASSVNEGNADVILPINFAGSVEISAGRSGNLRLVLPHKLDGGKVEIVAECPASGSGDLVLPTNFAGLLKVPARAILCDGLQTRSTLVPGNGDKDTVMYRIAAVVSTAIASSGKPHATSIEEDRCTVHGWYGKIKVSLYDGKKIATGSVGVSELRSSKCTMM